ncbi:hypothetical protein L493_0379 [Bordetella bronchiseptica 99-R-0433]|nr:hypothetical protein L493_0379 [Bordetella bronchiseptica 99-R-0433]
MARDEPGRRHAGLMHITVAAQPTRRLSHSGNNGIAGATTGSLSRWGQAPHAAGVGLHAGQISSWRSTVHGVEQCACPSRDRHTPVPVRGQTSEGAMMSHRHRASCACAIS